MAGHSYLAKKKPPPSALTRFFHQRVLPVAIDAAAEGEAAVERLAQRTRRQPGAMLGLAFGLALLLGRLAGAGPHRTGRRKA